MYVCVCVPAGQAEGGFRLRNSTTFQGNLELALLSTPFPLSLLSVSLGRKFTHYLRSPSVGARGHSGTVARLRSPRSSTTTYTRLLRLSLYPLPPSRFSFCLSLCLHVLASFSPPSSPNSAVRRFHPSPRDIPPPFRSSPPPLPAVSVSFSLHMNEFAPVP